jgi:hypothetical protein
LREMSPKIPGAPPCAGTSCNRIDLVPSVRAAGAWLAWLALVCAVCWFAVALPGIVRFAVCVAVAATGFHGLRAFVLLRGPRAIRAIEWNEEGCLSICLGATCTPSPAVLASGPFRMGARFWILRFATPAGSRSVLVEEERYSPRAFRRLSRQLNGQLRRANGRARRPAVTMPSKV